MIKFVLRKEKCEFDLQKRRSSSGPSDVHTAPPQVMYTRHHPKGCAHGTIPTDVHTVPSQVMCTRHHPK